jgi:hypothetical protein
MVDELFTLLSKVGIASVIIIAISAYDESPQGPFSIIFLDGPLGAGVGTVVGFFMWLCKKWENIQWKMVRLVGCAPRTVDS